MFSWFFWASVNTTYRLSRYPSESLFPHVSTCSRPFGLVSTPFHTCARVFRPSVSTRYRLRHFPSRITDFDRPSFSITNQRFLGFSGLWLSVFVVFLGVREHDLPTFTVPIRIVVSTPFHRFPADSPPDSGFLGVREHDLPTFTVPIRIVVSTRFHLLPPVLTCFHTSPPVPGRLATGLGFFWASVNTTYRLSPYPSESLFPHVSTCSRGRLEMFPHHSTPLHRFPADSPPDSGFLGVREHDLPTFPVPIRIVVSTRFHLLPPVLTCFHTFPPVPGRLATGLGFSGRP